MPLPSVGRAKRKILPRPPSTPNPASAATAASDSYTGARRTIGRAWEAPRAELPHRKNFALSSPEKRSEFCAEWDRLQSTKQLMGIDACETNIGGVILKKSDAFTALACQALTAYFEFANFLNRLNEEVKIKPTPENLAKIKTIYAWAKESFETLENILQLEGFKPYWIDKSKEQMVQLFELTAGKLWRSAATQHQSISSFLENISPEIVENFTDCKKKTSLLIGQLELGLTLYNWSPEAHFILDNFLFTDKDLSSAIIESLKPTTINLTSKNGVKKFQTYLDALTEAYKAHGGSALRLEINGELYNVKYAIKKFKNQIINCYLDFTERHRLTQESLQQKITQDELERAVRTAHLVPEISSELTHLRQELIEMRNIIPMLGKVIFSEPIRQSWDNPYFTGKKPDLAYREISTAVSQKLLFSNHEKLNIKKYLYYISRELAIKPTLYDQEIKQCINQLWELVEASCNEHALNKLFTQKPFSKLEWAFDVRHHNVSTDINENEQRWIEHSYLAAIEMLKSEWVNWERMQQFSLMIIDPAFQRMISGDPDKEFLIEIGKKLKIAAQNQQDFVLSMNDALGLKPLTKLEYHNAGRPFDFEARDIGDKKDALLSICNLHATNHFNLTVKDADFFLKDEIVTKWKTFVASITSYWDSRARLSADKDRYSAEVSSNSMVYIPFQLRMSNHPSFWEKIKQEVPIKYQDAILLTATRVKLATEEAALNMAKYPQLLPQLNSPHATLVHKKLVLAASEVDEAEGVMV
ncbi:MAG: hypothetical protein O2897_00025 [bacterium]|nr:hypothetical protein [bacterium]